jgi:thiamine pyrophosphate-dependent acetolactate synthase large subunit-like protein
VHLELPEDIAGEMIDDQFTPITYDKIRRPVPDQKSMQKLIEHIETAERPMILI